MAKYIEVDPIEDSICIDCCHRVTRTIEVKNIGFLVDNGTITLEDGSMPSEEDLGDDEVFVIENHFCKEVVSDIFGRVTTCSSHEKRKLEQYLKDNS